MKTLVKIDSAKLIAGLIEILKECGSYPVKDFEKMIVEEKQVSNKEAEKVTEIIINSGKIGWEIFGNNFVLLS